jgi:hypothetical protein
MTRNTPAAMVRNQNVDRQPRNWVRMPPRTGAKAGANMALACTAVM